MVQGRVRQAWDVLTGKPVQGNVTVTPPDIVVVKDFDDFLERGQPVEAALTDSEADHVTPLDLLHSDRYTTKEIRDERYAICKACPRLFQPTRTCRECGCFMGLKTWLKDAQCALHDEPKWGAA